MVYIYIYTYTDRHYMLDGQLILPNLPLFSLHRISRVSRMSTSSPRAPPLFSLDKGADTLVLISMQPVQLHADKTTGMGLHGQLPAGM